MLTSGQASIVYDGTTANGLDFVWDAAEATADDGVLYVQPTDIPSGAGRWCSKLRPQVTYEFGSQPSWFITGTTDGPSSLMLFDTTRYPRFKKAVLECGLWVDSSASPSSWATNTSYAYGTWVSNPSGHGDEGLYVNIGAGESASSGPGPTGYGPGPITDNLAAWRSAHMQLTLIDFSTSTTFTEFDAYNTLAVGAGLIYSRDVTIVVQSFSGTPLLAIGCVPDPLDLGPTYYTKLFIEHARLIFT